MPRDPLALTARDLAPYPELAVRRVLLVVADVLVLVWCVVWWHLADDARDAVLQLQSAGRRAESAGTGISDRLRAAGDAVDGVPFAGDPLAAPLRSAADAGTSLADAGRTAQHAVATTAGYLRLAIILVLVVAVALWWVQRRVRWTVSVVGARRLRRSGEGLQVLGLRAAARSPLRDVRRVLAGSPHPERLDAGTLEALGVLELHRLGLRAS